jgi:hypothetical protein
MDLQAAVDRERETVQRICTVATRRSCSSFADLQWGEALALDPFVLLANPGVMFETPRRVVVFQEICGELRYYAGGWCSDQERIYLEQDRMEAEGYELGVFQAIRDAVSFAEHYLVEEQGLEAIHVIRQVYYGNWPDTAKAHRAGK